MTRRTRRPSAVVAAAVDPEIVRIVIERRGLPDGRGMTGGAIPAKVRRNVVRVDDAGILGLVAGITVRVGQLVIIIRVTIRAWRRHMSTRQRKVGHVVVETRGTPSGCGVTGQAIMGIPAGNVVRRHGRVEVVVMTAKAIRREFHKLVARMALRTDQGAVRAREGEGGQVVIETSVPDGGGHAVTGSAVDGETGDDVARGQCGRVIRLMTGNALGRSGGEPSRGGGLMTAFAFGVQVPPHQRESGLLVFLSHVQNGPAGHRMAAHAVHAEFGIVNIRMTTEATLTLPGKHKVLVTGPALQEPVLSGQDKTGGFVIEFRIRTHLPGA